MFDPVCKFLVENHSADFAQWLLGEPIALSAIEPSELSLEPIRADTIILLEAKQSETNDSSTLHIEFQTNPDANMPFRMLDYWVRNHRRNSNREIRQVVIYLSASRAGQSNLVYQTRFTKGKTSHEFEVIRLWEQPFESFLQAPGLLPFAVLSRVSDAEAALRRVAAEIRESVPPQVQPSIGASTAILAGLVSLDESLIQRIIGMDLLEASSVYQSIKRSGIQEGRVEGLQEGRQEGRQEGQQDFALRVLARKIGKLPKDTERQVEELSVSQLERLVDALLDFSKPEDLERWLFENTQQGNAE